MAVVLDLGKGSGVAISLTELVGLRMLVGGVKHIHRHARVTKARFARLHKMRKQLAVVVIEDVGGSGARKLVRESLDQEVLQTRILRQLQTYGGPRETYRCI